ncbi:hypothetical protein [Treponema phagedenis]|uniref:Uncharacterized protein n=2 Tax=Treponema phagedenis TaxID=162 RepID=A0AAE6M746_TREPH|nr:hypothetical protein [Treponema phagedenis]QEJ94377.1 hypothetical protein FUT79_03580 [Treponema phagedenis]QEJ97425.1 hypothetical protein FUT82_05035 [Treponema phagedenis]QEJ98461.1 hypothetical protein FUT82_10945 [Treponema phagedenis]QEK02445.1 hypothetical protein FUT83_00620 [Treponema phagedenis]QEK03968.1 hypothetical protein FUT83_09250 [Treponema phagedenis]
MEKIRIRKLFNADLTKENSENFVQKEKITNIIPNKVYYVEHSIYFSNTMEVYEDDTMQKPLVLETDYNFAEIDSIASEMSNIDCYKALTFNQRFEKVFIRYHSYGDLLSAEDINCIADGVNTLSEINEKQTQEFNTLVRNFEEHITNGKAHNATETVTGNSIAYRTEDGRLKAADAKENEDLVNLKSQTQAIQTSEERTQNKITEAKNELISDIETLTKKVKAENPTLTLQDFLPAGIDESSATDEQKQSAEQKLDERTAELKPYHNVIRNKNSSIEVPDAQTEAEAVNKKALDVVEVNVANLRTGLGEISNRVEELENKPAPGGDIYKFDGFETETNKIWRTDKTNWNGVVVKRVSIPIYFLKKGLGKPLDLKPLNIDTITSIEGVVTIGKETYPLAYAAAKNMIALNTTKAQLLFSAISTNCSAYIVLEYF